MNTIGNQSPAIVRRHPTSAPSKAIENGTFGLDVVDFRSPASRVSASDNLTPPCIYVAESCDDAASGCFDGRANQVKSDDGCDTLAAEGCRSPLTANVKADNDLYPGCTGELAMSGCLGLNARDVKADNDLYPGCSGELIMMGCGGLGGVPCSLAVTESTGPSFLTSNLHI